LSCHLARARGCLLYRYRSLHCAPAHPSDASPADPDQRRRLKIIPNAFGEKAVIKLMFGAPARAAERWRSVKVTEFERRQLTAIRSELDQEYEAQVGLKMKSSKDAAPSQNIQELSDLTQWDCPSIVINY
jgi:hypothetical protein